MSCLFSYQPSRRGVPTACSRETSRSFLVAMFLAVAFGLLGRPQPVQAIIQSFDYGDAPKSYRTALADNGARHVVNGQLFLGGRVDVEEDGIPSTNADSDDLNPATAPDDEDGVVFVTPLIPGQSATFRVTASTRGLLSVWMDLNANGTFAEAGEQIITDFQLGQGANDITITLPAGIEGSSSYMRFRLSTNGKLSYDGPAEDGEVEDYRVNIGGNLDFGDAPENYPVLLSQNGARHSLDQTFIMGKNFDSEPDGQPSTDADADDKFPAGVPDDEDGVTFLTPLVAGSPARIEVEVTEDGFLDAWIDFGANGNWSDATDQIFVSEVLVAGINQLTFNVPADAKGGSTFARFRYSQNGKLSFTGPAPDGEVEDYKVDVSVSQLDFGDAPDSPNGGGYRTLLSQNGARHQIVQGFHLGKTIDAEPDGQPNNNADGDDIVPSVGPDDEDGVTFEGFFVSGTTAKITVEASAPGLLDAWVDFNGNVSWLDTGEKILNSVPLAAGLNSLSFPVPAGLQTRASYARFRFSSKGGLRPEGPAEDGEVEDYVVAILGAMDYGDAPPPYPTLMADDGARHIRNSDFFMGFLIDTEVDGQPNSSATGDDLNPPGSAGNPDDEDGVYFTSGLYPGQTTTVDVRVSSSGFLSAWVDFNRNGSWADKEDQIFQDVPVSGGTNHLSFNVPASGVGLGGTFARFRYSLQTGLSYTGIALNGEVEDYQVFIRDRPIPCVQTSKGSDFWLTFPANFAPDPDNPLKLTLSIVGERSRTGRVEIPGLGYVTNFVIPPTMKAIIYLPKEADLGEANDLIENKGIHVTADSDVAVFGLSRVLYTTDGFMGIPSTALGRAYVVQAYGNEQTGVPSLNGTEFAIVACDDNTAVAILPSVDVGDRKKGVPYLITLNKGETYQLRGTNSAPQDLSGTIVVGSKPIAVFGGHRCANINSPSKWFCDYVVEQILPLERAGRSFYTYPLATRTGGDTFRIYAMQNNTTVFVNGVAVATLNIGEFHERIITGGASISSENLILVTQFANSADHDPVSPPFEKGDPFSMVVPSTDLWNNNYMVCVPDAGYESYYLNVVIPTAAIPSLRLNGTNVTAGLFGPIGATGISGARIPVTPRVHTLATVAGTAAAPPFAAWAYGWAEYDSFGYPAGMYFVDKTPPELICQQTNVTLNADGCTVDVPDFRSEVAVFDNCDLSPNSVVIQDPPPGTPINAGTNVVTLSLTDANGNTGSCRITVVVIGTGGAPFISCPRKVVANCQNDNGAVVTFDVQGFTECQQPLPVVCDPPSGSFFPLGDTLVKCSTTNDQGETATCEFIVTVRCLTVTFTPQEPGSLSVSWSGAGVVQTASDPAGPWIDRPSLTSPLMLRPASSGDRNQFFRVKYAD